MRILLSTTALLLLANCSMVSFVRTGPKLPPLADGEEVRVFLTNRPNDYVEIGVEVVGGTLAMRVEKAN